MQRRAARMRVAIYRGTRAVSATLPVQQTTNAQSSATANVVLIHLHSIQRYSLSKPQAPIHTAIPRETERARG